MIKEINIDGYEKKIAMRCIHCSHLCHCDTKICSECTCDDCNCRPWDIDKDEGLKL